MDEKPATVDFGTPGLIEALPDALRTALESAGTPINYEDSKQIHSRGDIRPGLSIIRSGAVRFGNVGRDGAIRIPGRPALQAWIDARAQISPLETTSHDRP